MIESKIKDGIIYYLIWGGWIKEDRVHFTDDGYVLVNLNPEYEITISEDGDVWKL